MNVQIEESWKKRLQPEFDKDYFKALTDFVRTEYQNGTVYPPGKLIFNAFNLCPFDKVKVWPLLLCKRWSSFPTIFSQYLQRNQK